MENKVATLPAPQDSVATPGCRGCHSDIQPDVSHDLPCTSCHGGHDGQAIAEKAHAGMIAQPAHPDSMAASCGGCHPDHVSRAAANLHFTLSNKVNAIRAHFGAQSPLPSLTDIPKANAIETPLNLADDMLRRRCLRCHVYSSGDDYPAVTHGTGCSACHLPFSEGKLRSHSFVPPADGQCLSCHYGRYVGNDYYGRFEHDYNWEYRTPFTSSGRSSRPYGIEAHDLVPDIHQQRGLVCIDCHQGSGHSTANAHLTCASCHDWRSGQSLPPIRNLEEKDTSLFLTSAVSGKRHQVPALRHPAHDLYRREVACQVCHGQWAVNDSTTHVLLSFSEDFDPWERLTVQESAEVESLLERGLYGSEGDLSPRMRDGITMAEEPGLWLQGFSQRRWETMIVQRDTDGIIKVFRPLLDLRLSMTDENEKVRFDNVGGLTNGLLPYVPHTTGPAGLFYHDRFRHLLPAP